MAETFAAPISSYRIASNANALRPTMQDLSTNVPLPSLVFTTSGLSNCSDFGFIFPRRDAVTWIWLRNTIKGNGSPQACFPLLAGVSESKLNVSHARREIRSGSDERVADPLPAVPPLGKAVLTYYRGSSKPCVNSRRVVWGQLYSREHTIGFKDMLFHRTHVKPSHRLVPPPAYIFAVSDRE